MTFIRVLDPFSDMTSFRGTLNRILNQEYAANGEGQTTSSTFTPPVDIYEDEHKFTLSVEVPGLNENDFEVRVENNTLMLRGERKFEKETKEENFHRVERRFGRFARWFTLPNTVDIDKVAAVYQNGVLNIDLLKRAESKPKQIKVKVEVAGKDGKGPVKVA